MFEITPETPAKTARLRKGRWPRNDETSDGNGDRDGGGSGGDWVDGSSRARQQREAGAHAKERFATTVKGHAYQQQLVRVRGCYVGGSDFGAGELDGWERESFRRPAGVSHLVLE